MTFEGVQLQGAVKIMEKLNGLGFQKIGRFITSIDSQPMFDGGVLINVLGRLQCDDDPPHSYMQTFVLKTLGDSFFVQHDIFRLCIHDVA
ncbi:probable nuclear transport factor 2 isoform X2 [Cydia strobilella]|nr:probable nuclear transport factor 2 isoform X2 [Cydia pomonella]